MVSFSITIFLDVMELFRVEVTDDSIREEIKQRLDDDEFVLSGLRDDIEDENAAMARKFDKMSVDEIMKFVSWSREDSELNYDEMYESRTMSGVAISLGCTFNTDKAFGKAA